MTRTGARTTRRPASAGKNGRAHARRGGGASRRAPKAPRTRASKSADAKGPRLVGIDYSAVANPDQQRSAVLALALPVTAGVVCAALLLSALRADIVRTRYALAKALSVEEALRPQENRLKLRLGQLRSPHRLHRLARELGLSRPAEVQQLPAAEPGP